MAGFMKSQEKNPPSGIKKGTPMSKKYEGDQGYFVSFLLALYEGGHSIAKLPTSTKG